MAEISQIKATDGVTYDIRDTSKEPIISASNKVPEAFLSWGGANVSGSFNPIDAAMIGLLGANRLAFLPAANISVEYSRDGGSSWTTYSVSDEAKINLFNGNSTSLYLGGTSAGGTKTNYLVRVTFNTSGVLYTVLNKFAIFVSTSGSTGSYCTVQGRLQSNVSSSTDTWVTFVNKQEISGWSGWNIINVSGITTFGNTAASQYGQIRFIFGVSSHTNTSYPGLTIQRILGFGGQGWTTPSNMARIGHLYSYDYLQNAIFPAGVKATSFTENGTALSSKYKASGAYSRATGDTTTVASNAHTHTGPSHTHTYAKATSATFNPSAVNSGSPTVIASGTSSSTTVASNAHTHSVTAAGTLNSTGAHTHSVTAAGTLSSTGAHTHSVTAAGTLSSTGAHTHSLSSNVVTGSLSGTVLTLTSSAVTASSAGSHSHTFTGSSTNTNSKGGHSHTFTGSAVNTNETGGHSHTFTGSAVTSGTPSATSTVASIVHGHSVTASGTISLSHTSTNSGSGGTGATGAPSANTTVPTSGHTHGVS